MVPNSLNFWELHCNVMSWNKRTLSLKRKIKLWWIIIWPHFLKGRSYLTISESLVKKQFRIWKNDISQIHQNSISISNFKFFFTPIKIRFKWWFAAKNNIYVNLVSKCPEIGCHLWTFPIARIYLSKFKLYGSYRMNCDINDFELRSKVDSVINRLKANACIGSKNLMWKQQLNATLFVVSQDMVTRSINS